MPIIQSMKHSSNPAVKLTFGFFNAILKFLTSISDIFLFVLSLKVFPLAWHARSYYSFIFRNKFNNRPVPLSTFHKPTIFQPTIWTSNTPLGEIDIMGHKTNSTYATDFDVARNYHICSLFRTGMKSWGDLSFINPQTRDTGTSTSTDFSTGLFYPALAGVNFTFHKAIRPRQKYEICTRVLSWDEKWLHLISHFVERGTCKAIHFSDQNGQPDPERDTGIADSRDHGQLEEGSPRAVIFATAMAKIVFKKGRKTISPSRFLGDCGLLPQQDGDWKVPVQESVNQPRDENGKDDKNMANLKIGETIERMRADGYRLSEHLNSLEDGYSFYNVNESVFFSKC